jgi:geranylgeranyl diphosphate synthase type I
MAPVEAQRAHTALEHFIQEYFTSERSRFPQGEWFDPIYFDLAEYVGRKGKRIRPLILMMVHRALGGTLPVDAPALLRCATALELLHTFVLIHDDVIDRSETRRGLPTYHRLAAQRAGSFEDESARIGENIAIVVGDVVYALAIRALSGAALPPEIKQRLLDHFLNATVDTGVGELEDILFGVRDVAQITTTDIERMYYHKTTRYTFETPCVMGAILAGAPEAKITALVRATTPLGLAFQIQNDLLECRFRDAADLAACADLLEGKKTMVIREAYNRLDDIDRSFLQLCLGSARRSSSTLAKLRDLILKSGAIEAMQRRSEELFAQAAAALESPEFTPEESRQLADAVGLIRHRVRAA